ncbi:helix-turn-helix domain-containing protein [Aquipluma nitroreducens]|uniref:helix-turn-helix domain-containing protein n=1 Tax=Aquipluma nitroreducens TaxID=2010828 RepID=UPI00296E62A2|nr:helix-turn-helix domain-containing protein [Aquipluma nitroreducens]
MVIHYQKDFGPGNIRELENCIERACILCKDNVMHCYDLPLSLLAADSTNTKVSVGLTDTVEQIEKQIIREALVSSKGNIAKTADALKVTERMLGIRLKKYDIAS